MPWKNSWFQIALFALLVSGALLVVDYAHKASTDRGWTSVFHRAPKLPAWQATCPTSDNPVPNAPTPSQASDEEVAQGRAFSDLHDIAETGRRKNIAQAIKLFKKAAAEGNAEGARRLGDLYMEGFYIEPDYAESMQWFNKAAAQGDVEAELTLGNLYINPPLGFQKVGIQKDYAAAMKWRQKAAAQGDSYADYQIGQSYQLGMGAQQNGAEAMCWFQKAAALGFYSAEVQIGVLYEGGAGGIPKDYAAAMQSYQKAAAKGDNWAEYRIGYFYENGLGVQKDTATAIQWYQKAASQGLDDARQALARLQSGRTPQ
jgi:TPR repeat protein